MSGPWIYCPYCSATVAVQRGRLTDHPAMKGRTAKCIGSGQPVESVQALNAEHRQIREKTDRLTGRRA